MVDLVDMRSTYGLFKDTLRFIFGFIVSRDTVITEQWVEMDVKGDSCVLI
jgi:hypothetical protein